MSTGREPAGEHAHRQEELVGPIGLSIGGTFTYRVTVENGQMQTYCTRRYCALGVRGRPRCFSIFLGKRYVGHSSLTARDCQVAAGPFVRVELRQDCAR